jgi:hypothetical protein
LAETTLQPPLETDKIIEGRVTINVCTWVGTKVAPHDEVRIGKINSWKKQKKKKIEYLAFFDSRDRCTTNLIMYTTIL